MRFYLIFFLLIHSLLSARLNQDRDFQIWAGEYKKKKCNDFFAAALDSEWRLGNDAKELFYIHEQISTIFHFARWLDIAPCYRQIWRKSPLSGWKHIYNPFVDITLNLSRRQFSFSNRNRINYLVSPSGPNQFVYRNRLQLTYLLENHQIAVRPFISEEVFISERSGYNQNRVAMGLKIQFNQLLAGDILYMRQFTVDNQHWIFRNILGVYLFFNF